jgi:hypothetical protein
MPEEAIAYFDDLLVIFRLQNDSVISMVHKPLSTFLRMYCEIEHTTFIWLRAGLSTCLQPVLVTADMTDWGIEGSHKLSSVRARRHLGSDTERVKWASEASAVANDDPTGTRDNLSR